MSGRAARITVFVFMLCTVAAVTAQDLSNKITSGPVITGAVSGERLRFTAPNGIVQMHLQVYGASGELVFDVTSKGNVLDWTLQDSAGQHLLAGSYICLVTVKSLSGKLSQRIGMASVREKEVELRPLAATELIAAQPVVGPIEENGALTILKDDEVPSITFEDTGREQSRRMIKA